MKLRILAGLLSLLVGLGASARLPWGQAPPYGLLRLSWRSNGQEIRTAIAQDPNLPKHMQLPEGQAYKVQMRSYLLRVILDGGLVLEKRVEPAGLRHDRPLSVLEELPVAPGRHRVEVEFSPETLETGVPAVLVPKARLDLEFQAGKVQLVTFQEEGQWQVKP